MLGILPFACHVCLDLRRGNRSVKRGSMNAKTTLISGGSSCAITILVILAGCGSSAEHHPAAGSCAAWRQREGGRDLAAVRTDLAQTVTPGGGVWESEGTTLKNDAKAAALSPPPTSAGLYRDAMNDYATSGADQAADNVSGASAARKRGNAQLAAMKADSGGCVK